MKFAVLFDWDGVIMDSARPHEISWEALARENSLPLPEDHFIRGFGKRNETIIPEILGWTTDAAEISRLSLRKEELYRGILGENAVEPLPGVRDLLNGLNAAGIPCAVGSSTARLNIELCIRLLGLDGCFQALVTGDDVSRGKPDPEVFLKGAKALGMEPTQCVVFEDSLAGIEAGLAGGMKVVGVATTNPLEKLHRATWAVDRLTAVNVDGLRNLFR